MMSSDGDKACLSQSIYPCWQGKCEVKLAVSQQARAQITGARGQTQAQLQAGTEDTKQTSKQHFYASGLSYGGVCGSVFVAFLKALGQTGQGHENPFVHSGTRQEESPPSKSVLTSLRVLESERTVSRVDLLLWVSIGSFQRTQSQGQTIQKEKKAWENLGWVAKLRVPMRFLKARWARETTGDEWGRNSL